MLLDDGSIDYSGTDMVGAKAAKRLHDACMRMGRYQPSELLRWLAADVLAGFGVRQVDQGPEDLKGWLCDTAGEYARAVIASPFEDVLGTVYQMLGSNGHRSALGQYFTPSAVARIMAEMIAPDREDVGESGRLLRACEPACGSGALLLGFMQSVIARKGRGGLKSWSLTGIDLDHLCAQICATQVLSNVFVQCLDLGELVIYRGNALGPSEGLSVVVHASAADLTPDLVLPAMHPGRIAALRAACGSQGDDAESVVIAEAAAPSEATPVQRRPRARPVVPIEPEAQAEQVDLFGE